MKKRGQPVKNKNIDIEVLKSFLNDWKPGFSLNLAYKSFNEG